MRLTFRPGEGWSSKRVTTGPGCTATTCTSIPKSSSLTSTCRDMASRAAFPMGVWETGAGSSNDNGGSPPSPEGSKRGTCRSISTRTLGCTGPATGSIRGGARRVVFALARATTVSRSCLALRARSASLSLRGRPATQDSASIVKSPTASMTANQDRPVNSVTPTRNSASRNSVAPRGLNSPASPLPTTSPRAPPAASGRPRAAKCNVARPEPAVSVSRNPLARLAATCHEPGVGSLPPR